MTNACSFRWKTSLLGMTLLATLVTVTSAQTVGSGISSRRTNNNMPRSKMAVREKVVETPVYEEEEETPRSKKSSNSFVSQLGTMHKPTSGRKYNSKPVNHQTPVMDEYYSATAESCDSCTSGDCDSGSCGDSCDSGCATGTCDDWCCQSCLGYLFSHAEMFSGVQAYSGPANRGGSGSFGYHEGFNMGIPLFEGSCWDCWGLGLQAGGMFTQSNLNGTDFTDDSRTQFFGTLGFYRRVDWGLQWGLAFDYLHEDLYYQADIFQTRGELSWMLPEGREFGFMFTDSLGDDTVTSTLVAANGIATDSTEILDTVSLYAFFVRGQFCNNSSGRLYAGWTSESDGLVGGDFDMPLDGNWLIRSNVVYRIPEEGKLDGGHIQESWNMGISFVWLPGCSNSSCDRDYYRPLFNVANNGNMMTFRR